MSRATTLAPEPAAPLTPRGRRRLRALAHALRPVVSIGGGGVSDPVVAETSSALDAHTLVKVKLPGADRGERRLLAQALAASCGAALVQVIGRIAVLYREPAPG